MASIEHCQNVKVSSPLTAWNATGLSLARSCKQSTRCGKQQPGGDPSEQQAEPHCIDVPERVRSIPYAPRPVDFRNERRHERNEGCAEPTQFISGHAGVEMKGSPAELRKHPHDRPDQHNPKSEPTLIFDLDRVVA